MNEKVVVITGASSGIGAALAKLLAPRGNRLVLAARNEAALKQVAATSGNGAIAVVTDVTCRQDVEHLREAALESFGHVDVWINNAGRGITRSVMELTDDDFDTVITVNLRSALYGMQTIVPHFQQRGTGHLINVSSFLGRVPLVAFRSLYSASKAALNTLTANLRMDLKAAYPNIHISLVMPGIVTTDFAKNAIGGMPASFTDSGAVSRQSPEEVAATIADLIDNPRPEIYTSPMLSETAVRYYSNVGVFEEGLRQRG